MVRADCEPKKMVRSQGQEAATAGDMVRPVSMVTGRRKSNTVQ